MDQMQAEKIAEILGGQAWQSGGGVWLVLIRRQDGGLVAVSDEAVTEYSSEEDFENSEAANYILFS